MERHLKIPFKTTVNSANQGIKSYNRVRYPNIPENPNDLYWLTEKIKKLGFGYEIMNHNSLYHTHNILIADNRQFYSIIIKS